MPEEIEKRGDEGGSCKIFGSRSPVHEPAGGCGRRRCSLGREAGSLARGGRSEAIEFVGDFGGEGAVDLEVEAFFPGGAGVGLLFQLGEAEAGIVVDGEGGETVDDFGILGELVDELAEVVASDAPAVEDGGEMVIVDGANEADVGIVRAHGNGPVHAVAAGHKETELAGSDEGIAAGEGVGTAEVDEEDSVVRLLGSEFLEPGNETAGGILVSGLRQGVHFIDLIEEGMGVGLRGGSG